MPTHPGNDCVPVSFPFPVHSILLYAATFWAKRLRQRFTVHFLPVSAYNCYHNSFSARKTALFVTWRVSSDQLSLYVSVGTDLRQNSVSVGSRALKRNHSDHTKMPNGCGNDQITVKEPGKDVILQCLNCPRCSMGSGASVQCYSVITPETSLMCKACVLGETFSAEKGTGICEHCYSCPKHNRLTVKDCTLTSDSECGGCKPGFYPDRFTSQCEPCSPCCGDGKDTVVSECKDQSMPDDQVCRFGRSKPCGRTSTPPRPATTAPVTASSPSLRKKSGMTASKPKKAPPANSSVFTSKQTVGPTPKLRTRNGSAIMHVAMSTDQLPLRRTDDLSTPMLAILFAIVLVILAIVYRLKYKRWPTCRRPKRSSIPTIEEGGPESAKLVGMATDEQKQEEEGLPTQNTEGPGRYFVDKPLVEMSHDSSRDFYVEVNQVIVKAGGADTALHRFETTVGEVGIDPKERVVGRVFVDAVMKKYPLMSGKEFFEAVIGKLLRETDV